MARGRAAPAAATGASATAPAVPTTASLSARFPETRARPGQAGLELAIARPEEQARFVLLDRALNITTVQQQVAEGLSAPRIVGRALDRTSRPGHRLICAACPRERSGQPRRALAAVRLLLKRAPPPHLGAIERTAGVIPARDPTLVAGASLPRPGRQPADRFGDGLVLDHEGRPRTACAGGTRGSARRRGCRRPSGPRGSAARIGRASTCSCAAGRRCGFGDLGRQVGGGVPRKRHRDDDHQQHHGTEHGRDERVQPLSRGQGYARGRQQGLKIPRGKPWGRGLGGPHRSLHETGLEARGGPGHWSPGRGRGESARLGQIHGSSSEGPRWGGGCEDLVGPKGARHFVDPARAGSTDGVLGGGRGLPPSGDRRRRRWSGTGRRKWGSRGGDRRRRGWGRHRAGPGRRRWGRRRVGSGWGRGRDRTRPGWGRRRERGWCLARATRPVRSRHRGWGWRTRKCNGGLPSRTRRPCQGGSRPRRPQER